MEVFVGAMVGAAVTLTAALLISRLLGFGAQRLADYADGEPAFDTAAALSGRYLCEGMLHDFTGKPRARFTATMEGRFAGDAGVLKEHFRFADGLEQHREWRITLLGGGRLDAIAHDIVGRATGEQRGNALRMRYRLRLPTPAGTLTVSVTDWMYLTGSGAILNRSEMRKFGIKVAELTAVLKHAPAPQEA